MIDEVSNDLKIFQVEECQSCQSLVNHQNIQSNSTKWPGGDIYSDLRFSCDMRNLHRHRPQSRSSPGQNKYNLNWFLPQYFVLMLEECLMFQTVRDIQIRCCHCRIIYDSDNPVINKMLLLSNKDRFAKSRLAKMFFIVKFNSSV